MQKIEAKIAIQLLFLVLPFIAPAQTAPGRKTIHYISCSAVKTDRVYSTVKPELRLSHSGKPVNRNKVTAIDKVTEDR